MGKEPIVIEILGTELRVNTDEDPRYLSRLIEYLKEKTDEVRGSTRIEDPLKVSILTSLFLIDELYKEQSGAGERPPEEAGELAQAMIRKLDATLES
jgi:cell division protein ZapA (FtsZ GTPase activity inhibitor)